jgi:hypothetical protein
VPGRCITAVHSYSMQARIAPQYRHGKKLTPRERGDQVSMVGFLHLKSEQNRQVMLLLSAANNVDNVLGELWMPVLSAMFSDTFRLTGIEKSPSGAWVHQAWYCEVGGAWRHRERMESTKEAMHQSDGLQIPANTSSGG